MLAVLAFLLANDLLFARLSREKRYVVCPVVDLCNHHSSQAGVEAAYEYFADAFAVVLPEAVPAGGEVRYLVITPRGCACGRRGALPSYHP